MPIDRDMRAEIARIERAMPEGMRLRLSCDYDRIIELNRRHAASWPRLIPMFDPAYCALGPNNMFWLEALDASGATTATHCCRYYPWRRGESLRTELPSLRFLYDAPEPHQAAGERFEFREVYAAEPLDRAVPTICAGGLWVHPDFRRKGLEVPISYASKRIALSLWRDAGLLWALRWVKTSRRASVGAHEIAALVDANTGWRGPLEIHLIVFGCADVYAQGALLDARG